MGTSRHPEAAIGRPVHVRTCKAGDYVVAVFKDMSTDWLNIHRVVTVTNDANEFVRALLHIKSSTVVPETHLRKVRVITDVDMVGQSPACGAAYKRDAERTNRRAIEEYRKQLEETVRNEISAVVGMRNAIFPFNTPREMQDELNRVQQMYSRPSPVIPPWKTDSSPNYVTDAKGTVHFSSRCTLKPDLEGPRNTSQAIPPFHGFKVAAPASPPKPRIIPTAKADGISLEEFYKVGWTDQQLVDFGYAVEVKPPTQEDIAKRKEVQAAAAARRIREKTAAHAAFGRVKMPPFEKLEIPATDYRIYPSRKSHSAKIVMKNIFDSSVKTIEIEIRDYDGKLVYGGPLAYFQIHQGGSV